MERKTVVPSSCARPIALTLQLPASTNAGIIMHSGQMFLRVPVKRNENDCGTEMEVAS